MKKVTTWRDTFFGHRVYSPTAGSNVGHNWKMTDTSAAGTPTYAPPSASNGRGLKIDFDNTNEVQNVDAALADLLQIDIDDIVEIRLRVIMNQAAVDATSTLTFGLKSARNDNPDSTTANAQFKIDGSASTTAVVVETDDNVNDNDDKATGKTLINAAKDFVISFARGKKDVRFFVDGEPVAEGTTFDMSNYTAGLQPFIQLQKTANVQTNGVTLLEVELKYRDGL